MGAVGCFLALAIAGLAGREDHAVRAAYVAMKVATWAVIGEARTDRARHRRSAGAHPADRLARPRRGAGDIRWR
jgi:hypothetical protein